MMPYQITCNMHIKYTKVTVPCLGRDIPALFTASFIQHVLCFSGTIGLISGLRAAVYHSLSLAKILLCGWR